jgi:predicted DNA repair protein MutK
MAFSSLLTLLDDISTVLDDVAAMTKIAARKTAGVLGDDLALNAQQVSGVRADRELSVVWAVAKGSARNKLILVPLAILISALAPWAIAPLLVLGGVYLCFEGVEKLAHRWLSDGSAHHVEPQHDAEYPVAAAGLQSGDHHEGDKISGAIRTDFILSAEIIVIALGTVAEASLPSRIAVLTAVAILMTVGVYGAVAAIVKLDDLGLMLSRKAGHRASDAFLRRVGASILSLAPWLMKSLSVVGTIAMFLVGGGILVHGVPALHHAVQAAVHRLSSGAADGGLIGQVFEQGLAAASGVAAGAIALALWTMIGWVVRTDR